MLEIPCSFAEENPFLVLKSCYVLVKIRQTGLTPVCLTHFWQSAFSWISSNLLHGKAFLVARAMTPVSTSAARAYCSEPGGLPSPRHDITLMSSGGSTSWLVTDWLHKGRHESAYTGVSTMTSKLHDNKWRHNTTIGDVASCAFSMSRPIFHEPQCTRHYKLTASIVLIMSV